MSTENIKENNNCKISDCDLIKLILEPHEKDLGEFKVKRLLPSHKQKTIGPWIFFDHFGPASFKKNENAINVRPHPHIGLATVTYLFDGEIFHRDSLGSAIKINPGDINLMVSGKGIVHSERENDEIRSKDRTLEGLQLWLALPKDDEECDPEFHNYSADSLPKTEIDGVEIRVMMGEGYGIKSKVKTFARTFYAEARLKEGQEITLPNEEEKAVYVLEGELETEKDKVKLNHLTIFCDQENIKIKANQDSKIAIIGGEKFDKRYIEWNFVASNKELINKAKEKWKNQGFDKVIGDEEEFIPLP